MKREAVGVFEGVDVDQLYREHLLDHYRNPRNFGRIEGAAHFKDMNPLCGDEVEVFVKVDGGKIGEVKFTAKGCAISIASTSILSEYIIGKISDEAKKITLEGMQELVGVKVSSSRAKCMMLGAKAIKSAIYLSEGGKNAKN